MNGSLIHHSTFFKRDRQFDRPHWDVGDTARRYLTTSEYQSQEALRRHVNEVNGHCRVAQPSVRDNISRLFCYPKLKSPISASANFFKIDDEFKVALLAAPKEFALKRNEYSDYNERRLRFGFKF
jgi:hypothetical protein